MNEFSTTRRVQHSARKMFDLVADIDSYPQFVPLCERLKVRQRLQQDGHEVVISRMTVAYKFISESFTTRAVFFPEDLRIEAEYLDGPFRHLDNRWTFHPQIEADGSESCDVEFFIAYAFKSRALELLMGSVFDKAFRKFSTAFERRADEIYGVDRPNLTQPLA